MNDIKVVVFDCDGVLFNTEKVNRMYYNQILNHFGMQDITPGQFAYAQMHTVDKALANIFEDIERLEAVQEYRSKMDYLPFIKYMQIEPCLKLLLKWLKPKYKTAIATNRSDTMDHVLAEHDLEEDFNLVVTALDVANPKPHPEPLLKILEYFKIAPRNAIYVGDSKLDETAAMAAGIPLIAYDNKSLSADFHITSLKEIETILENID